MKYLLVESSGIEAAISSFVDRVAKMSKWADFYAWEKKEWKVEFERRVTQQGLDGDEAASGRIWHAYRFEMGEFSYYMTYIPLTREWLVSDKEVVKDGTHWKAMERYLLQNKKEFSEESFKKVKIVYVKDRSQVPDAVASKASDRGADAVWGTGRWFND